MAAVLSDVDGSVVPFDRSEERIVERLGFKLGGLVPMVGLQRVGDLGDELLPQDRRSLLREGLAQVIREDPVRFSIDDRVPCCLGDLAGRQKHMVHLVGAGLRPENAAGSSLTGPPRRRDESDAFLQLEGDRSAACRCCLPRHGCQ